MIISVMQLESSVCQTEYNSSLMLHYLKSVLMMSVILLIKLGQAWSLHNIAPHQVNIDGCIGQRKWKGAFLALFHTCNAYVAH